MIQDDDSAHYNDHDEHQYHHHYQHHQPHHDQGRCFFASYNVSRDDDIGH